MVKHYPKRAEALYQVVCSVCLDEESKEAQQRHYDGKVGHARVYIENFKTVKIEGPQVLVDLMNDIAEDDGMFMENYNLPDFQTREEFDFNQFSEDDKSYVESFICNQMKVFYREQEFYDFINITPYSLFSYFPFKCRI